MGDVASSFVVLADAIGQVERFVVVFASIYGIVILAYILLGWVRLPYSVWLNRIQRFLYDVSEPYIRLFRRFIPPVGPLDLSPMVALIVLGIFTRVVIRILELFH